MTNRTPVLTLWAALVGKRLGFPKLPVPVLSLTKSNVKRLKNPRKGLPEQ